MARDRPSPYGKRHAFFNRSAGDRPPRSHDLHENRTPANAVSRSDRGTARDRPSPYGETETASPTVARGTGPRDLSRENISSETLLPLSVGQEHLLLSVRERALPNYRCRQIGARGGQAPALRARTKKRGGQAPALR